MNAIEKQNSKFMRLGVCSEHCTNYKQSFEMKMFNKKRKIRSSNFSELEMRLLVDAALKYVNVIENKKSDSVTWKEKNNTW